MSLEDGGFVEGDFLAVDFLEVDFLEVGIFVEVGVGVGVEADFLEDWVRREVG